MGKHLAVDIGSESGRISVGYLKNGKLIIEELHRFKTQFMQAHRKSVRNIYRYHEEIIIGLKKYVEKYGDTLDSIGVDSWGGDFVLLDRKGNICKLPESYRATSAASDVSEIIEKEYGLKKIYEHTGNQAMPTDTLSQMLRMIRDNDPSMDDPHAILFMGDVYHYLLGAEICCEHSLAGYSRFYNNNIDCWDESIMKGLQIPLSICTKVVCAGDTIGQIDPVIQKNVGLKKSVNIITPCTHDTSCAALAIPDMGTDWMFISSGTWSLMGMETDYPIINEISYKYNFSNSSMPLKTNMFKKNIQGMWIIQQCREAWGNQISYEEIVSEAAKVEENHLYIDVDREEFYAPGNMPMAIVNAVKRDFHEEIDWKNVGVIARICFESLALKYRYFYDKLIQAADKKISKIYIIGGGSNNQLVNQYTANVIGLQVYTGVTEGSNVGNLLLQLYGSGELSSKQEMRQCVCDTFLKYNYSPQNVQMWKEKYHFFENEISHEAQW